MGEGPVEEVWCWEKKEEGVKHEEGDTVLFEKLINKTAVNPISIT